VCFAATKRIVSDQARIAPLLHFNYRYTRKFMTQNAKRIDSNDTFEHYCIRNACVCIDP